jgi:hypothetical protein
MGTTGVAEKAKTPDLPGFFASFYHHSLTL